MTGAGDTDATRQSARYAADRERQMDLVRAERDDALRRLRRNKRISVAVVAGVAAFSIFVYGPDVVDDANDEMLECLNTYMPRGDATSTEIGDAFGVCFDGDEPPSAPEAEVGPPPERPALPEPGPSTTSDGPPERPEP